MATARKALRMLFQLSVLYGIASCSSVFLPDVFLLRNMSTFLLMAFSLALLLYFAEHIIERDTRKYLVSIAGLITLWIVLRGAKYIAFEETEIVARHIWYLYYIPALLIPLLSLFAALSVGERSKTTPRWKVRLAIAMTLILTALVLSNDLHQLAFRFRPGFALWDTAYQRTPVFYAVYVWIALESIGTIYILFTRCRVSASRRLIWIPMLPALFGIVYLTLYANHAWPRVNGTLFGEMPEAVCFTIAGIWLSLMYIGLIPSNAGYGRLFQLSDLTAQITDRNYQVIFQNPNAASLSIQQRRSDPPISLDQNTRVLRKPIYGGFVYWQDDITELNRINAELWEVSERLSEEAELTRLENELKEERAQIEAKTKTYDMIAVKVLPQSQKIAGLCAQAEHEPERYAADMKTVCVLATYIKRYANLSLLAADHGEIEANELFLSVQESIRAVRETGVPADIFCAEEGVLPAKCALDAYALFESALEQALPMLRGVQVSIRENTMKCVFEGAALRLSDCGGAELTAEDGTAYLRIPLREAGESA